jgi:hypothetical protein
MLLRILHELSPLPFEQLVTEWRDIKKCRLYVQLMFQFFRPDCPSERTPREGTPSTALNTIRALQNPVEATGAASPYAVCYPAFPTDGSLICFQLPAANPARDLGVQWRALPRYLAT